MPNRVVRLWVEKQNFTVIITVHCTRFALIGQMGVVPMLCKLYIAVFSILLRIKCYYAGPVKFGIV